ncbi:E3 ubiquitin-protein ligase RNF8-like [Photinus pyralis]|uniref:E3 ubiquitin-protein ligase RNF8-like n=1 Tax=Photinus pyralis TaxID=7054 RepID=UPI00126772C9|nr:E3 ubiquitin-protein ligase RNF8-like [Photinus pyralis]
MAMGNIFTKFVDGAQEELLCSICTELFIKAVTLSCSHTFCKLCIDQWRKYEAVCPICRSPIKHESPTIVLDNYIDKIVETRCEKYKHNRKIIVAEREALASSPPNTISKAKIQCSTPEPIQFRYGLESLEQLYVLDRLCYHCGLSGHPSIGCSYRE